MSPGDFVSALLVGLLVGALGRLVVPGRQPIGCLLTVAVGVVGSVAGLAVARAAGVDSSLLVFGAQVGIAAVCVAVVAAAMRGPRSGVR